MIRDLLGNSHRKNQHHLALLLLGIRLWNVAVLYMLPYLESIHNQQYFDTSQRTFNNVEASRLAQWRNRS